MTTLTLTSVKSAWYTLIASGSALTTARASLGAGGVMTRQQFRASPLAAGPLIVIHYGPVTGQKEWQARTFYPTIFLYDDAQKDWKRLNALADLLEAEIAEDAIAYCETRYATGVGEELTDGATSRPCLPMRYQIKGRF